MFGLERSTRLMCGAGLVLTAAAAIAEFGGGGETLRFIISGLALAALAGVIGQAIEATGERLSASATGLLQSTLGNLPELFVGIFALHAGLLDVVRAALIGSILSNALLVLGCAFIAGGLRHGTQKFDPEEPRLSGALMLLAVGALMIPTLARHLSVPAHQHLTALSDVGSGVLLAVYLASIAFTLRPANRGPEPIPETASASSGSPTVDAGAESALRPSLMVSVVLLVVASAAAAFVSEWFVDALRGATVALGLNQTFTGLVVVAIASNAVEHAVGIRFALKARPSYALSATLSSPLQIALLLTPVLVLVSNFVGPTPLSLVFPPLLVASVAIATLVVVVVVYDGEYTWMEGVALVGLYVMIAAAFWWG